MAGEKTENGELGTLNRLGQKEAAIRAVRMAALNSGTVAEITWRQL